MSKNNTMQSSIKKAIGLSIWNAIENSGYSRDFVAIKMGVSIRMVNYWQDGEKQPTIAKSVQLADFLGCSLDDLLRN